MVGLATHGHVSSWLQLVLAGCILQQTQMNSCPANGTLRFSSVEGPSVMQELGPLLGAAVHTPVAAVLLP